MARQQRAGISTQEQRALELRARHAVALRRRDPAVDPHLLLAAVVWPARAELAAARLPARG